MSTLSQTIKEVEAVKQALEEFGRSMEKVQPGLENSARAAENQLRGGGTGVEQRVSESIKNARDSVGQAVESAKKATQIAQNWISSH